MTASRDWVLVARDAASGIETIRGHFEGHAYDKHCHEEYLVGVTEEGLQEFDCRGRVNRSTPGRVILVEPGEMHDGRAPKGAAFTYLGLYLPPEWVERSRRPGASGELGFRSTLADGALLGAAIRRAYAHLGDTSMPRLAREAALDALLDALEDERRETSAGAAPEIARRAREILHDAMDTDPGLPAVAALSGAADRFQLSRAFRAAYGMPPHAYLVQLRLTTARRLLAAGESPAAAAAAAGFADQSHLGRWFRRAYRMTPAAYRRACTNIPDRGSVAH